MTHIWLQGTAALDLASLNPATAMSTRSELVLRQSDFATGEISLVPYYFECGDGWLHVPKGWLMNNPWLLSVARYTDNRSDGDPLPPGTRAHVTFGATPHPPRQPQFIDDIVTNTRMNGHGGLALAPTRAGKTLCSLEAACRLGRSTLILVDNVELMKQWAGEVRKHLHVGCGWIRQDVFDVSEPFTVATTQTLVNRQLPEEIRRRWGTVIVDECNMAPCQSVWTALSRLHNRYLIGLTATPERKDGLEAAVRWIVGPVIASLERQMDADVHWLPLLWTHSKPLRSRASPVQADKCLMDDVGRLNVIAKQVALGVQAGRRVLLMATLVEHLERLAHHVRQYGIDVDLLVRSASKDGLRAPVTAATYKKASKGLDFDPPHTLFIPAGPVADIRQAVGRALQPNVPHRTMILHPVDLTRQLIKWAVRCSDYYSKCGFTFRNQPPHIGMAA